MTTALAGSWLLTAAASVIGRGDGLGGSIGGGVSWLSAFSFDVVYIPYTTEPPLFRSRGLNMPLGLKVVCFMGFLF